VATSPRRIRGKKSFAFRRKVLLDLLAVTPSNPWPDPNQPAPGMSLPVAIGPIPVPQGKLKRRWKGLLIWSMFVFAGGIAAGAPLNDHAFTFIESTASFLRARLPWLAKKILPAPPANPTALPPAKVRHAAPPALPPVAPSRQAAVPEKAVAAAPVTVPTVAPFEVAETPELAKVVAPGTRSTPRQHAKPSAKPTPVAAAPAPARKTARADDPFDTGGEGGIQPKAAAPAARAKPAPAELAPAAKNEAKPAASRPRDSLDNLMADVVTDTKAKGKKHETKDIDAMLKDVQKSNPEPAPKQEAAPPPASLSPADIAKVMATVKTRGNTCAQRLGQQGNAELNLAVGKNGKVTDVHLGGKLAGTPLGACIEKAARAAVFPPSAGLRFDYRIDVR
jgi:hypothetical protein